MSVYFNNLNHCPYCLNSDTSLIEYNNNIHCSVKGLDPDWCLNAKRFNPDAYQKLIFHKTMAVCNVCKCLYKIEVPSVELLFGIYQDVYAKQKEGESRFSSLFCKKEFTDTTLEIGGGNPGISSLCKNTSYYNLDPNSDRIPKNISSWNIEKLTNTDLKILRSLNIQNIVACDVIEHLMQPFKLFELASSILNTKGKFFLHVGQFHKSDSSIKDQAIHIQALHLSSACSETIHHMARKYGFRILENETKDRTAFVLQRI